MGAAKALTSSGPGAVLRQDQAAAAKFAERAGKERLREALERAQADLEKRLKHVSTLGAGSDSFSAAQVKATLEQVRGVLRPLQGAIQAVAVGAGGEAAETATGATLAYLQAAEQHFTGIAQPLALNEAAIYESSISGTNTSILARIAADPAHPGHPGVLARYGTAVIGKFETELQQRFLAKTPWETVKERLVQSSPFLQGAPAHWAERIVRTEVMGASNRASWETIRATDEQLGDLCKILSCAFDTRTGADSIAVHGEIRRPDEAFESWFGAFQHPPDRPNDRAVVVPHRISWPIPPYLQPMSDGDVAARWAAEGHKGGHPGRPNMSTIDRALFGVQKPPSLFVPPLEEETVGGRAPTELQPFVPGANDEARIEPTEIPAIDLHDPNTPITWGSDPMFQGESLNGVALEEAKAGYWNKVKDRELGEAEIPSGQVSTGCIVIEPDGRMWIVEPKDHFGGYDHTYPKGQLEPGLSPQRNALKELFEESGLKAEITGLLGDYKGDTGTSRYYVARRTGGAPWKHDWEAENVKLVPVAQAEQLLNTIRDKKILADLIKKYGDPPKIPKSAPTKKKPVAPPVVEAAAAVGAELHPVPPMLEASTILGTKIGAQGGSNPGGTYLGTDGVKRYVKFYAEAGQAVSEHLANQVYRDLGLGGPRSTLFMHEGRLAYASEIMEGGTLASVGINKERAKQFAKGFAADVLTANWDAVGLSMDNAFVMADGTVVRADSGGSFLYRAQKGKRKGEHFLNQITEWQGFFDPSLNANYRQVMAEAGIHRPKDLGLELAESIGKISALRDKAGGWKAYVERMMPESGGMSAADQKQVIAMLEARTKLLEAKAASEKPVVKTAGTPEPARPGPTMTVYGGDSAIAKAAVKKILDLERDEDVREKFYKELYAKAGQSKEELRAAQRTISSWTGGYKGSNTQAECYKAFADYLKNPDKKPTGSNSTSDLVRRGVQTRRERWKAAQALLGHPDSEPPEFYDIARGLHGKDYAKQVANAWADDSIENVTLDCYALASWSLDPKVGTRYSKKSTTGVNMRWKHCPSGNTVWDQVTDDSSFITSFGPNGSGGHEAEIIAGPGHDKGITLPKVDHEINYHGKIYTYAERYELFDAMKENGEEVAVVGGGVPAPATKVKSEPVAKKSSTKLPGYDLPEDHTVIGKWVIPTEHTKTFSADAAKTIEFATPENVEFLVKNFGMKPLEDFKKPAPKGAGHKGIAHLIEDPEPTEEDLALNEKKAKKVKPLASEVTPAQEKAEKIAEAAMEYAKHNPSTGSLKAASAAYYRAADTYAEDSAEWAFYDKAGKALKASVKAFGLSAHADKFPSTEAHVDAGFAHLEAAKNHPTGSELEKAHLDKYGEHNLKSAEPDESYAAAQPVHAGKDTGFSVVKTSGGDWVVPTNKMKVVEIGSGTKGQHDGDPEDLKMLGGMSLGEYIEKLNKPPEVKKTSAVKVPIVKNNEHIDGGYVLPITHVVVGGWAVRSSLAYDFEKNLAGLSDADAEKLYHAQKLANFKQVSEAEIDAWFDAGKPTA